MRNRCPPSRGIRRMLPPSWDWIAHLVRMSGEVGGGQDVDDPPRVHRLLPDELAADALAHPAAGAVGAEHIPGAHGALLAVAGAAVPAQPDDDGVLAGLVVAHLQVEQLEPVVGPHARRCVGHRLGEVVLDACLVDDDVRELADAVRIVGGHAGADDARGVLGIRPPKGHRGDPVGLLHDAVREAERLERLDRACLHAVRATALQTSLGALDQTCRHPRELGELRRRDVAGRAAADDQHVDLVRELGRPLAAVARRGLHAGITRDVSMVVELHGARSPLSVRCGRA